MESTTRQTRVRSESSPQHQRVLSATLAALAFPGAGHARACRWRAAIVLAATFTLGALPAILHLVSGLSLFETTFGAFLFRVLLRGLAILYAFSVIDVYFHTSAPSDGEGAKQRLAMVLNLLVPGAGYLVARAWLRAGIGFALLAFVLFVARVGNPRYLDLIYVLMQLITAAAVYHHMILQRKEAPQRLQVPAAQILVLLALVFSVCACGYVIQQGLPEASLIGIEDRDIRITSSSDGISLFVEKLGLSLKVAGTGWQIRERHLDFLLAAEHPAGAFVRVTRQPIPPFVRPSRYVLQLRRQLEEQGLVYEKTLELILHGVSASQLRFSGNQTDAYQGDHWAIAVPQKGFAYVLMLYCKQGQCDELAPLLERSRDSFSLVGKN